jgi:hypothetical protein
MQKRILCYAVALLFSSFLPSQEATVVYSADKPIWDLRNFSDATDMSAQDDGTSQVFNLGFDFDFFGQTFDKAYMASNGCVILGSLSTATNWEKNCTQYEPSEAPNTNYTMYPFWTDLIMGGNSSMLAMQIDNKVIFGWYEMWEFNRNSKNTFELWLYPNDSYEARYDELDIQDHDVFIGIQGSSKEFQTYYFHDECNTGIVNSSTCVNQSWNDSTKNSELEYGGSLLVGEATDCSDPLVNPSCTGYWDAYDDQQCNQNPQYAPFCTGYNQQDSVAYFNEDTDYGYQEEDMWYDEEYDEWLDPNDPCYQNNCEGFTDADWYALDTEQFGQEQVDEWFGTDINFSDDGMVEWDSTPITSYNDVDVLMDVWDVQQEQYRQEEALLEEFTFQETFLVEDYSEPETFIEFNNVEELEEWFDEETNEHFEEGVEEEFATLDEPEEEFIEEIFEEEVVEEIFEAIEERLAEAEVEEERLEKEEAQEEFKLTQNETTTEKNKLMVVALDVVRNGVQTATSSFSTATSGSANNNSSNYSGSSNASTGSSSSSGGISTSSSPSSSDQFASASAQTNQVLSMSDSVGGSDAMSTSITPLPTFDDSASMVVADVQVSNVQGEIDTALSGTMTASEADQIADQIIADNISEQQEEQEQEQEDTGRYGDESTLVALIGYVPDFDQYKQVTMSDAAVWYSSSDIYTSATLDDNTSAFYGLVNDNLKGLSQMINDQPNIWR